jgi:hypothetical protein
MVDELLAFYSEEAKLNNESDDLQSSIKLTKDNIKAIIMVCVQITLIIGKLLYGYGSRWTHIGKNVQNIDNNKCHFLDLKMNRLNNFYNLININLIKMKNKLYILTFNQLSYFLHNKKYNHHEFLCSTFS